MDYPTPTYRLSAEDLDQVTTIVEGKLRSLIRDILPDTWLRGMEWYFDAHDMARTLAVEHSLTIEQTAGIIAALSPRISWESNLDDATTLVTYGEGNGFFAFGANVGKALWILDGSDPDIILGGRKVRSFYRNIAMPWNSDDVTLDRHMTRAMDIPDRYLDRARVYDAVANGFRNVAEEVAVRPHQLQATVWVHVR